jgi:O-antigen/teichoic acid export membrane protein
MGVFATTGIVYTIGVALLAILLIPSFGLQGYILSLILSHLIASLYAFLLSKSYKYFGLNALSRSHLKTLLVYGIPLIPNTIMWWMVNGLNRPIMENYLGLSAIGLYAVASKFPGIVSMMSNVLSNAWGISVLDEFGKPGFSEFFNKTFRMLTFFSFVIAFFLILFSKYVIMLFTSESFYDAWHVLPLLIVGAILNSSTGLVGGVFMGMKKSVYFFYSSAASAVVSVIATFLLIQPFGIIGCAVASAVSFLVALVLRLIFAWKYIKGFDILQYTSIILVLVFTNIVLELSLNMVIKIVIFTILFSLIIIENRNLLIVLKNNFKWKRS